MSIKSLSSAGANPRLLTKSSTADHSDRVLAKPDSAKFLISSNCLQPAPEIKAVNRLMSLFLMLAPSVG
ncbi:hypothetical protein D3C78_1907750 [compost metagenome]